MTSNLPYLIHIYIRVNMWIHQFDTVRILVTRKITFVMERKEWKYLVFSRLVLYVIMWKRCQLFVEQAETIPPEQFNTGKTCKNTFCRRYTNNNSKLVYNICSEKKNENMPIMYWKRVRQLYSRITGRLYRVNKNYGNKFI